MTPEDCAKERGLERCEFDDECDSCDCPTGGSWVKLYHAPEDVTEAEFYICGTCLQAAAICKPYNPDEDQTAGKPWPIGLDAGRMGTVSNLNSTTPDVA